MMTQSRFELPTDREPTEHEEQRDLIRWFRQSFPGVLIFAIPNGGKRGKREAAKLKAEGVTAGVPDLFVPAWDCWIEMKRQRSGRVSPEQRDMHNKLRALGHRVVVAKGSHDAQGMLLAICHDGTHRS